MAGGTGSASSLAFKDAYFTHPDDVKWCLETLDRLYGLDGKTALEPSAGSNVFPKHAPNVSWTTNELFPEFSNGTIHDYNLDFAKDDLTQLGTFDFVIGNPPYGRNSTLARKFVLRSLELSNVVAMVVPKAMRRRTMWDKWFPDDCKVVFEEDLPNSTFDLPDGTTKHVGVCFLILEKIAGYSRGKMLDEEPNGYLYWERRYCKVERAEKQVWWPDPRATHGMVCWGSAGKFFGRERTKPYASCLFFEFTDAQAELVAKIDWEPIVNLTKTSVPMLTRQEIFTEINKVLVTVG